MFSNTNILNTKYKKLYWLLLIFFDMTSNYFMLFHLNRP